MIFDGNSHMAGVYLRFLADEMGLRDWTICVAEVPEVDENYSAAAQLSYGRKWVTIALAPDWATWREQDFRQTCVHELLHCHIEDVWEPLNSIKDIIGSHLYEPAHANMRLHIEHAIDAIATEWGRRLLLPSEWAAQGEDTDGDVRGQDS